MTEPRDESPQSAALGQPTSPPDSLSALESKHADERILAARIQEMHEGDLVDFIRDTIVRLDALADRLEVYTDDGRARGK